MSVVGTEMLHPEDMVPDPYEDENGLGTWARLTKRFPSFSMRDYDDAPAIDVLRALVILRREGVEETVRAYVANLKREHDAAVKAIQGAGPDNPLPF